MVYPTIPIEPRANITVNYKNNPYVNNLKKGQVTTYRRRNFREVTGSTVNYSIYVENIVQLENFLMERAGWKPFYLTQDGCNYICTEYSVVYLDLNKANIQINLVRCTN